MRRGNMQSLALFYRVWPYNATENAAVLITDRPMPQVEPPPWSIVRRRRRLLCRYGGRHWPNGAIFGLGCRRRSNHSLLVASDGSLLGTG